ncbi:NUDIX domain-containing protein [Aurantiacibacter spongiae]|uniref:NUDIX domain-containing protein n=1 Tax=Aurantiacibacter spongiae TaxID=2488860 RepID=A0A3N5DBN3_9SPHN|nr:NUDIX domain-containing protein [Aurantiacibacter spongiae]RPF72178.1 NUDIX domain-containing protein [Aurantiacibacter spongiae]
MLHLIPARAHRALMPLAHRVRRTWLRWRRPQVEGVSVVIGDGEGRVLLVRQSYATTKWLLPAGGKRRGESAEDAIRREMREELGCELAHLSLFARHEDTLHGAPSRTFLFAAEAASEVRPDMREVIEARFFAPGELPDALERRVRPRLAMLEGERSEQR